MIGKFLVLFLALGLSNAKLISMDCLSGGLNPVNCCKGVPTSQDVLLRNPSNCNTYYQCVHEYPVLRPCPANLHWSVKANRCEWPEIAGCTNDNQCETNPPTDSCLAGFTSAEECCKGVPYWKDLLLPNPEDCGSYIQCVHEKPMVRPCPAGLHWSIEFNRCEWPNVAKCQGGVHPGVEGDCLYGRAPVDECCRKVPYYVDVLLKNPGDCNTYYQCVHQTPVLRPCPEGLKWSVEHTRCEWADLSRC